MTTPDLFDAPPAAALPVYRAAFDDWVRWRQARGELREDSSQAVYRCMWNALTEWCVAHGLDLDALQPVELEAYLMSRGGPAELSDRYAWRVLRLFDDVTALRARSTGRPGSGAARELLQGTPRWRFANAAERTPLPDHLDATQARQLVAWLLGPGGGPVAGVGAPSSWQHLRARASVALQMGAGLTPAEIRAVAVEGVVVEGGRAANLPWKARVPALGPSPAREAPIAPWAGRLLRIWLDTRTALMFGGTALFPAARDGRPWGRVAQYNAARAVLAAAGVADADGGSYRLRHTFALRQLRRGSSPDEVARWLGLADANALWRYRRVLMEPADVV